MSHHRSVWRHAYQAEALAAELRKLAWISGVTVRHSMCAIDNQQVEQHLSDATPHPRAALI